MDWGYPRLFFLPRTQGRKKVWEIQRTFAESDA